MHSAEVSLLSFLRWIGVRVDILPELVLANELLLGQEVEEFRTKLLFRK